MSTIDEARWLSEEEMKPETVKTCSICQCEYTGWGNNAQPVNNGRCCDDCNSLVILARLRIMQQGSKS